jgi:DNA-binding NarL/FixJ family response regulator
MEHLAPDDQAIKLTAVLITSRSEQFGRFIEEAGYDIVGASDTATYGERVTRLHEPDLVVIDNSVTGDRGWDAVRRLRLASPTSRLLFVVEDDWSDTVSLGPVGVITRTQLEDFAAEPALLEPWIATQIDVPVPG